MKLHIIFIVLIITILAGETVEEKYKAEIENCMRKNKVFSFDTKNCVDANLTINPQYQMIVNNTNIKSEGS